MVNPVIGHFGSSEFYHFLWRQPWGDVEEEEDQGNGPPSLALLCQRVIRKNMEFSSEQVKSFQDKHFNETLNLIRFGFEIGIFPNFRVCIGKRHLPWCEVRTPNPNASRTSVPKLSSLAADKIIDHYRPLEVYITALYGPKSLALRCLHTVLEAFFEFVNREGFIKQYSCQGRRITGYSLEEFEPNLYCPPSPRSDARVRRRLQKLLILMGRQAAWTPKHERMVVALRHHLQSL